MSDSRKSLLKAQETFKTLEAISLHSDSYCWQIITLYYGCLLVGHSYLHQENEVIPQSHDKVWRVIDLTFSNLNNGTSLNLEADFRYLYSRCNKARYSTHSTYIETIDNKGKTQIEFDKLIQEALIQSIRVSSIILSKFEQYQLIEDDLLMSYLTKNKFRLHVKSIYPNLESNYFEAIN